MLGAQNRFLASLEMTILKLLEMPLTQDRLATDARPLPAYAARGNG